MRVAGSHESIRRVMGAWLVTALIVGVSTFSHGAAAAQPAGAEAETQPAGAEALGSVDNTDIAPAGRSSGVALGSGELRTIIADHRAGTDRAEVTNDGKMIVEVLYTSTSADARRSIDD